MGFHGCRPACICLFRGFVAFPPGMIAECGGVVGYGMDGDSAHSNWSGMGWGSALAAINGTGKSPGMGTQWKGCFRNDTSCGCYHTNGCQSMLPTELADGSAVPGVRDHAVRGGMGAIRIKFVES